MKPISGMSYQKLKNELLGKKVHFKSDCELFPNFDVKGKVIEMHIGSHMETIMKFLTSNGKTIDIGSNMKNLKYELL